MEAEFKKSWSSEIAWRLCRIQELFLLKEVDSGNNTVDNYKEAIEKRIPSFAKEKSNIAISTLREIALPSIIHLLQKGISEVKTNKKDTTLNSGFDERDLRSRHTLLKYQHRMHDDISKFPAKEIYKGEALQNGRTIDRNWNYGRYPRRSHWLNVTGIKGRKDKGNLNAAEAVEIVKEITMFIEFAKNNPPKEGSKWTVACLTYYRAQENELKKKIRELYKNGNKNNHFDFDDVVEVMVYSVDKFQGKEADVVFLSMVKAGGASLGFMDSPNRLNVALTRAKYQLVIVGDKDYFHKCKSLLLQKLEMEH